MWEQPERILGQATSQMRGYAANFLPGVLVTLTLILVSFIVALVARLLLVRALRGLEFDRRTQQMGVAAFGAWPASATPSLTLGRAVFWIILALGFLISLTALNATIPSQMALSVFEFVPNVVVASMILVGGAIASRLLARSVLIGAVNMQVQSARLVSLAGKWVVLLVSIAMALDQLGIGRRIVPLAFGILFGGLVFAASLAVGLGAKDAVRQMLEGRFREAARGDDKLDHV